VQKKLLKNLTVLRKLKGLFQKLSRSLPTWKQTTRIFDVLNKKERIVFLFSLVCFLASGLFLFFYSYLTKTKIEPDQGGILIEGLIGQPRFINPVLAISDVDRDLIQLLFAGLMRYDNQGNIVPDLIKQYSIKENGKVYEIELRDDIFWHDGERITTDDVIFTIKAIQNPKYNSPEIINWIGVDMERISEKKMLFVLKNPYYPFLERLTIKILPKHIFEQVSSKGFALTSYNLQPIGSGPFVFKEIHQEESGLIHSLTLARNKNYHLKQPYLDQIVFHFFENKQDLEKAISKGEIQAMVISEPKDREMLSKMGNIQTGHMPRYFAVFFNPENNKIINKVEVRQALTLATNKQQILRRAINNQGRTVDSPIMPNLFGFQPPEQTTTYNLQKAQEILEKAGFELKDGRLVEKKIQTSFKFTKNLEFGDKGNEVEKLQKCLAKFSDIYPSGEITGYFGKQTREAVIKFQEKYRKDVLDPWNFSKGTGIVSKTTRKKLNEVCNQPNQEKPQPIKLTITTVNQPFLLETAQALKEQWEKLGFEVFVRSYDFEQLSQDYIKPRNYDILLFGEVLNIVPDPFAFWHSSRTKDPGLNLALYKDKDSDTYLEKARKAQTLEEFKTNLEKFQNTMMKDYSAIILYSPDLNYLTPPKLEGVDLGLMADPSKRFEGISNWYIKTKRVWKY
jgi:peptide/nickel transport system substrate-binding protein